MNDCTYDSQFCEFDDASEPTKQPKKSEKSEDIEFIQHKKTDAALESNSSLEDKSELLWHIDDDTLFYPLGLKTHGDSNTKCVFVTWSENYLINFVFKTSVKKKRTSLTKVRLAIEPEDAICDILILELNTLLLMRSGRVFYFSSVKSMHAIPWLSGVRCMSLAKAGFSCIRLLSDTTLCLEVYKGEVNFSKSSNGTLLQRYDITFDERNIFNCQWQDESFMLYSQTVPEEQMTYMEELVHKVRKLHGGQEVHFFSVSKYLFVLIDTALDLTQNIQTENTEMDDTTTYHIELLCTYASNVSSMQILPQQQLSLVFLDCGSIDIWFMSHLASDLRRKTHYTGTQYSHYEFCRANNCFYFTDEKQLAELKFKYVSALDDVLVEENYKSIPGILACTWSNNLQQLVCLNSNNIFYRLTFTKSTKPKIDVNHAMNLENLQQLYELTPSRITLLLEKANIVKELIAMPFQLHKAIEQEFVKQQLIAIRKQKRLYSEICKATLEFHTHLPVPYAVGTVLLHTNLNIQLNGDCIYALLHLSIAKNYIFENISTLWQLDIKQYQSESIITMLVQLTSSILHAPLCVVIPLKHIKHKLLPRFQLELHTFIKDKRYGHQHMAISLPFTLSMDHTTYANLFNSLQNVLSLHTELELPHLISRFQAQNMRVPRATQIDALSETACLIKCSLTPPENNSFKDIASFFNLTQNDTVTFDANFMSTKLRFSFDADNNCVNVVSTDATAIFYAKLYIILKFKEIMSDMEMVGNGTVHLKKSTMQFQCNMERYYSFWQKMDADYTSSYSLHFEKLNKIYDKMRKENFYIKLFNS